MKLRLRFTKTGKIRWTSHRDVARVWERALRRAEVPVRYTEGFSPRPKVSFGLALPTGAESLAEYLDVAVRPEWPVESAPLLERLDAVMPAGMACTGLSVLSDPAASLQEAVVACTWTIGVPGPLDDAVRRVEGLLEATSVPFSRVRKGKETQDDLRPAVLAATVSPGPEGTPELTVELATQPRSIKPAELLAALWPSSGDDVVGWPLRRTHQWMEGPEGRVEPVMPVTDAPEAPAHALERAS